VNKFIEFLEDVNQGAKSALEEIADFMAYFLHDFIPHWGGLLFILAFLIVLFDILLAFIWR